MNVTVIGCGVSGLTTGIRLLEENFQVTIVARELPPQTTSDKAAAIWFPYKAYPEEKVRRWAEHSYRQFERLCRFTESGVSLVEFLQLYDMPLQSPPEWTSALPDGKVRRALARELPNGYRDGYIAEVPLIETPIYMPYLLRRFERLGGKLIQKELLSYQELQSDAAIVVNCSGLGALQLARDKELFPIQGHILRVKAEIAVRGMADDDGHLALAYVIPRRDDCILGGTAINDNWNTTADPETVGQIRQKCSRLQPALEAAVLLDAYVGLRPGRREVRLEAERLPDQRWLIHNYGHGGSGFTVSWGCAEEVVRLLKRLQTE
ncbi:MAG TPA: FAD-dependent oxidoreductase [bacterium]